MFMRFRGGGIGHTSTRAETDVFKTDRDDLDIQSRQDRNDALDMDEEEDLGDEAREINELPFIDIEMIIEGAKANNEAGEEVDQEGELMDSEVKDYGYESESELETDEDSDNDSEEGEAGEEDDTTIDELGVLGYGDY
jgi:hypothetical protein